MNVMNGFAYMVDAPPLGDNSTGLQLVRPLCFAKASCASLTVEGADADALMEEAFDELLAVVGVDAAAARRKLGNGRRLQLSFFLDAWAYACTASGFLASVGTFANLCSALFYMFPGLTIAPCVPFETEGPFGGFGQFGASIER